MKKRMLSIIAAALLATIAMPVAAEEPQTLPMTSSTETQIPNPFVACDSLQEAAKLTGFPLAAPETLRDYPERSIHVTDHKMIQVSYQNAQGKTVTLRKAAGSGDISGDFRQYTQTTKETIAGISATVKRTNARAYVAIWNQDGYTYSIQSSHGLDNVTLQHLIQAKEAEKTGEQLPNPLLECKTLQDAADITGFSITVPERIDGYPHRMIQTIDKTTIEVRDENQDGGTVMIRKAAGNGDISGDYNQYPEVASKTIDGVSVTCKGKNGKIFLATWTNQGYTYSISIEGMPLSALNQLVRAIK